MRDFLSGCLLGLLVPALAMAAPHPPSNGPKATVVHETNLYVQPASTAARVAVVQPGREMVVIEKNGPWDEVFANTDAPDQTGEQPEFGPGASVAPPVSGWMRGEGVVDSQTPKGDLILFGVAATEEFQASQPHPPRGAADAARRLYQRVADFFPNSPLAPEAAWRSADIHWQLMKADVFSLPSAHSQLSYMREQIDETQMKKLQKMYPQSRWSDLAAWDMLDNKICGSWQGSTKCPEMEAKLYLHYAIQHPRSPKAADALYQATYREGVLHDMYKATGDQKKAEEASQRAIKTADILESTYPQSDYAARAAALVYKLQASIPIYGLNQE